MNTRPTYSPELSSRVHSSNEFAAVAEPYRHELQVHCYRMLGSLQDAEDLVQETLLRAWQKRAALREQSSLRAWLYKIATNACLDSLDRRPKRVLPAQYAPSSDPARPAAPPVIEPIWLEPIPDSLLADPITGPEARYSRHESISLAFLAALQTLPPRQRAVLILRDVLEWSAEETAQLLNLSVSAGNSALHRARVTLTKQYQQRSPEEVPLNAQDPQLRRLLNRYVQAWEASNLDDLLSLLKEDATLLMPPSPSWYLGKAAIGAFASIVILPDAARGGLKLVETRANDAPAFAWYWRTGDSGELRAFGIQTMEIQNGLVSSATLFMNPALFPHFGLPEKIEG